MVFDAWAKSLLCCLYFTFLIQIKIYILKLYHNKFLKTSSEPQKNYLFSHTRLNYLKKKNNIQEYYTNNRKTGSNLKQRQEQRDSQMADLKMKNKNYVLFVIFSDGQAVEEPEYVIFLA